MLRPLFLILSLCLVALPALAVGPEPLEAGRAYSARGLIACVASEDAIDIAKAVNTAPQDAEVIEPGHPAFETMTRLIHEARCAQFDSWLQFTPRTLVLDGRQDAAGKRLLYHVIEAEFAMADGAKTLFLLTDRPFVAAP